MRTPLVIRDLRAAPGTLTRGFLPVGETVAGPVQIPVALCNGAEDGPILCLTAGVHATEYPPIDAVMRVIQSLDPAGMRGAVIAVPVVNLRMFESRSPFVSPLDGLNLNKIAPGSAEGSLSQVLAQVLLTELIGRAAVHIDLHGGDLGEMLLPFAGYALSGRAEQDALGETLARLYSPGLVSLAGSEGLVPPFPDGIAHAASQRGVVSIFAEAGGNGTLEEADVQIHLTGILNVMRHLGMIPGSPVPPAGPRILARERVLVRATRAGLLRLKVRIGDAIAAGQEVAEVCNLFGEVVERVRAPGAGLAGLVWAHKVVHSGDPILRYWVVEPS